MCPGFTNDLQVIDEARKTTVIEKELARLNIHIACLQETCLADSGSIREANYTFYWQGLSQGSPRQHGNAPKSPGGIRGLRTGNSLTSQSPDKLI